MVEAIKDFKIDIDKKEVCRYLGYRNGRRPKSSILLLIDKETEEAHNLIQTSCFYQLKGVKRVRSPQVILEDGLTITSEVLSRVLPRCQQVAIFVVNIGRRLEKRVNQLMEGGQMLRATILDAVGSEAVEEAVDYLQNKLRELANSDGAEITMRYSPGYCDWDITQQRVLFEAMNSAPLGVSLTDECLMVPRKSVSGLIGLGRFEKYQLRLSPCLFCTKTECLSRR